MKDHYEKCGYSLRLERMRATTWVVESSEQGTADQSGASFVARSLTPVDPPERPVKRDEPVAIAAIIDSTIPAGVQVERMTIAIGVARHRLRRGRTTREWADQSTRVHLSLVNPSRGVRAWIDIGTIHAGRPPLALVADAARVLARLGPRRSMGFRGSLVLAPPVAAALWTTLVAHAATGTLPAKATSLWIAQRSPSPELRDGEGAAIHAAALYQQGRWIPSWPNVFRPSYRFPPRSAPLHVEARMASDHVRAGGPIAAAVVEPFEASAGILRAALLLDDGDSGHSGIVQLAMTMEEWLMRVAAIGPDATWFPYGGGTWGSITRLEDLESTRVTKSRG